MSWLYHTNIDGLVKFVVTEFGCIDHIYMTVFIFMSGIKTSVQKENKRETDPIRRRYHLTANADNIFI